MSASTLTLNQGSVVLQIQRTKLLNDLKWIRDFIWKVKQGRLNMNFDKWLIQYQQIERNLKNVQLSMTSLIVQKTSLPLLLNNVVLSDLSKYLHDQGRFTDALKLNEKILYHQIATQGPTHLKTLETQFRLAICLENLYAREDVLQLCTFVYKHYCQLLGADHSDTLKVAQLIIRASQNQGRFTEALQLSKSVYDRQIFTVGPNHTETMETESLIAISLHCLKEHKEATHLCEALIEKAAAALDQNNNEDTVQFCDILSNCAWVLQDQGNYGEALNLYEKVYQGRYITFGPNNLKTVIAQYNQAFCLHKLKNYDEALKLYNEVLEKSTDILGQDHPLTLKVDNNIAWIEKERSKNDFYLFNF